MHNWLREDKVYCRNKIFINNEDGEFNKREKF